MSSIDRGMCVIVGRSETRIVTKAWCAAASTEKFLYKAVQWLTRAANREWHLERICRATQVV